MDERDTLVINDDGSFYKLNGGLYKKTSGMLDMLEESNLRDNPEKMTLALKNAHKCNKSKWMRDSIIGALAIVFGGVAATIAGVMMSSLWVLLAVNLGVITLTVGDQIFRVENTDNKNVSRIRDMCEKFGISYSEVSNTKQKTKSKDMLVQEDAPVVSAEKEPLQSTALSSLGKTFSMGASKTSAPSSEPVRLEVPRLNEQSVESTRVDTAVADTTASVQSIDTVKTNNDSNVKNILAGLQKARASHEVIHTDNPVGASVSDDKTNDGMVDSLSQGLSKDDDNDDIRSAE